MQSKDYNYLKDVTHICKVFESVNKLQKNKQRDVKCLIMKMMLEEKIPHHLNGQYLSPHESYTYKIIHDLESQHSYHLTMIFEVLIDRGLVPVTYRTLKDKYTKMK